MHACILNGFSDVISRETMSALLVNITWANYRNENKAENDLNMNRIDYLTSLTIVQRSIFILSIVSKFMKHFF
jgi:hypothetical protein